MSAPTLSRRMIYGRWNEQTRVYDIPGHPGLPSVTSVIGMKAKPALINWAAKLSAEYSQEHREALNELEPEAAVDAIKGSWRRSRDKAANFGTAVHEAIESGTEPDDLLLQAYVRSSQRALQDLGVDVVGQEMTLVSVQHGYAGTADVQGTSLDGRIILDWKSGKNLYPDNAMQLIALMMCDHIVADGELVQWQPCDVGFAVRLTPTRWYYEKINADSPEGAAAFDSFLGLIPVWNFTTQQKVWNT